MKTNNKKTEQQCDIPVVTTRFTFDCWYLNDGIPSKRYIDANDEKEAITLFKEQNPEMGYDHPYE